MKKRLSTDCVHAGEDRDKPHDSITTPIIQSSTFVFKNSEDIRRYTKENQFRYEAPSGPRIPGRLPRCIGGRGHQNPRRGGGDVQQSQLRSLFRWPHRAPGARGGWIDDLKQELPGEAGEPRGVCLSIFSSSRSGFSDNGGHH